MSKEQELLDIRLRLESVGIYIDRLNTDLSALKLHLDRYLKQDMADDHEEDYTVRGEERDDL